MTVAGRERTYFYNITHSCALTRVVRNIMMYTQFKNLCNTAVDFLKVINEINSKEGFPRDKNIQRERRRASTNLSFFFSFIKNIYILCNSTIRKISKFVLAFLVHIFFLYITQLSRETYSLTKPNVIFFIIIIIYNYYSASLYTIAIQSGALDFQWDYKTRVRKLRVRMY